MINPASLIGAIAGFLLGLFFFGSPFLGLIFSLIGSSIGSGIGFRVFRGGKRPSGNGPWFSGWGYNSATDGPVFMETLFSMLGRLAAADGRVSPEEEQVFRNVVTGELRITDPRSVASALEIFRKAAAGSEPMGSYARKAASAFRSRPQLLEMMLIIMIRVAAAEGSLHPEEDRLMGETASVFGFRPGAYESLKARYGLGGGRSSGASGGRESGSGARGGQSSASSTVAAYETLGVVATASEADIRKAYRKKASEYHPDKIAAKGLPQEFTELANSKFQEIQQAWDQIRQERGF